MRVSLREEGVEIPVGGDLISGFLVEPADGGRERPGLVLLHEVHGLTDAMRETARRLAREGFAVLAPDLFSREGGPGPLPDLPSIRARVAATSDRRAVWDAEAACAFLEGLPRVDGRRLAAIGLCLGGTFAFLLAAHSRRLRAAVTFYGRVVYESQAVEKPTSPIDLAANLSCPWLGLFGERDEEIPRASLDALERRLSQFGKEFEIAVFPRAGHGFLDASRAGFDPDAAAQAWRRAIAFLRARLGEDEGE